MDIVGELELSDEFLSLFSFLESFALLSLTTVDAPSDLILSSSLGTLFNFSNWFLVI